MICTYLTYIKVGTEEIPFSSSESKIISREVCNDDHRWNGSVKN